MATTDEPDVLLQDETQCRVLGVDGDGWQHIHDRDRDRIVVISELGIDEQIDIGGVDRTLGDWMRFVDDRRGWMYEQWDGYRLADVWRGL